jgi:hypothetical protein
MKGTTQNGQKKQIKLGERKVEQNREIKTE